MLKPPKQFFSVVRGALTKPKILWGISKNETLGGSTCRCSCGCFIFWNARHFFTVFFFWVIPGGYLKSTWQVSPKRKGGKATKSTKIHRFCAMQHPQAGALFYISNALNSDKIPFKIKKNWLCFTLGNSHGIIEIRTPSTLSQEGSYFSNGLLLGLSSDQYLSSWFYVFYRFFLYLLIFFVFIKLDRVSLVFFRRLYIFNFI